MGIPPTDPEFVAAMLGTWLMTGVGLFISPVFGANDDAVAMLETELLLVGLPGLTGMNELGEAGKPADGCFVPAVAVAVVLPCMLDVVGVGVGVDWFEDWDAAVLMVDGVW
jgi:hypothetical protein